MYKHIIRTYIIPYLQKFKIKVKRPLDAFDCIFCKAKKSAKILPGSYNYDCFNCKPKTKAKYYNIIDVVRQLEKFPGTEEELYQHIRKLFDIKTLTKKDEQDLDTFLDFYVKNKFDLVPVAHNQKCPVEKEWTKKTHLDKEEWMGWLANNLNLGVKTGEKSGVIIIDIDQKPIPEDIKKIMGETLMQETTKGYHLFYKYDKDFPKTRIDDYKIDIENNGGQVVIYPSKINGVERIMTIAPIIQMPSALKKLLLDKITVPRKTQSEQITEEIQTENFKMSLFEEGARNSSLIKLGGVLRKGLNLHQTTYVLNVLNKHNKKPLPQQEINAMLRKLDHYTKFDEEEISHQILDYLKQVEEASRNEVALAVVGSNRGEDKKRIDKALQHLVIEGYLQKKGTRYGIIKKLEWKENLVETGEPIKFKVPFFHDIANFNWGDLLLIGSKNKKGKTHISMNIVKQLVNQGIKPYYISLETGSRFAKIALQLGLKEGDFRHAFCSDPTKIEIEPNAVTIIDWLLVIDKSKTDLVFRGMVEQLYKTNGLIICFQQLKDNDEYFAPNMCKQFPSLSARYIYDNDEDGEFGQFKVDVVREPKIKIKTYNIACRYDWETKLLERVEDYQNRQEEKKKKK